MGQREDLSSMFDYDQWANLRWWPVAKEMGQEEILLHNLIAQIIWLSRIEGTPIWEPSVDQYPLQVERATRSWKRMLLGADLQRTVSYKTTLGTPYDNTVGEIVRHVINHGTYHRGQLRGIAGERGIEFPETDYVFYLRENAGVNNLRTAAVVEAPAGATVT